MEAYSLDGVEVLPFARGRDLYNAVTSAELVISHCGDNGHAARIAATHGVPSLRLAHGHIEDPAVLTGATLVVFNSYALALSVECSAPWIVVHPPVHPEQWRTVPGDHVTLINLSEAKGGELFWRLVRGAPHRSFLGVIGWGVQYIAEAPNANVIANTEHVRDEVYARTRVLLMPSSRETWGMAAIEAYASGIPVIAHPTPGLIESLGEAGIFVDRDDHQGWLDEIERLHDPAEWASASARALARSAELDPQPDLDRFVNFVEGIRVAQCV
jgi:hypothetical protein